MTNVAELVDASDGCEELCFHCPACDSKHHCRVTGVNPVLWNGSLTSPTLHPSVDVRSDGDRCHSMIRDGVIEFLSDSTHVMAGKRMILPEVMS